MTTCNTAQTEWYNSYTKATYNEYRKTDSPPLYGMGQGIDVVWDVGHGIVSNVVNVLDEWQGCGQGNWGWVMQSKLEEGVDDD